MKSDAAKLAQTCRVKNLLVSHFEPNNKMLEVRKKLRKQYKGKIVLAKDLMKVKV